MQSWTKVLGVNARRVRWIPAACLISGCLLLLTSSYAPAALRSKDAQLYASPSRDSPDVTMVIASQLSDDVHWLDAFPEYAKLVYVTDDPTAAVTVPQNKGREGMAYIINNYDKLGDIVIFSHSARYQWHNDDPLYDGEAVLSRLNLSYVKTEGYVNLRCGWSMGCPAEIHPLEEAKAPAPASDPESADARAGSFYKDAFEELFPNLAVPEVIGAHCCAQFAVTADKIRERTLADYRRYRGWLLRTPLSDALSGRILEYAWHIIFNKPPVHCPNAGHCYCELFGLCGLDCESEGICRAAYTLPPYSTLPTGWPDFGWEDEWRNVTELKHLYELESGRAYP